MRLLEWSVICTYNRVLCNYEKEQGIRFLWTDRERFPGDIKWIKKQNYKFISILYYILCMKKWMTRLYTFIFTKKGADGSTGKCSRLPLRGGVGWMGAMIEGC